MSDPFDVLRVAATATAPDAQFTSDLRDRLRRAVLDEGDLIMIRTAADARLRSLTPYLAVTDARRALTFYVEVFGAVRRGEPIVMDDGRVGHAELAIGDAVLMLAEEFPEIGHVAGPGGASIRVEVADVDESVRRAAELGAEVVRPAGDTGHGRGATVRDPFGQRWLLAEASPEPQA